MIPTTIPEKKALLGEEMAVALGLKKAKPLDRTQPRYQLGNDFQTKGPVGVYEVIIRLAKEAQKELAQFEVDLLSKELSRKHAQLSQPSYESPPDEP